MRGSQVVGLWMDAEPDPVDSMYSDLHNRRSIILQVCYRTMTDNVLHRYAPGGWGF